MISDVEKSIFFHALEFESQPERDEYVKNACGDDLELLNSVTALLSENDNENNVVDNPIAGNFFSTDLKGNIDDLDSSPFPIGTEFGPYRLMELIGEGGFGLVYVARQDQPVRRNVALKIIKPGMGSKELLARFEAEKQALALMDHENIAKVFDAGLTDAGLPYFAMELVRGVPLMEFCDNHKLDPDSRLRLFLEICNAVQHAHQKGIIHRDLKPANILVTIQDGRPIPKVIDFGLVKAISQSLTDRTIYTRLAAMMGTPSYMSPEQAEMSNVDVDTRSDIYSLGVILYELLSGSTPFEIERLNNAGIDELRHIIKDEEPPRPSIRFSTLANEMASTISVNRQTEPVQLVALIKGDLDWIVMKALDKVRGRRYSTATAFAEDVSRFLNDQPVEARPPSRRYRFAKFARRNRVALLTAAIVFSALVVGTVISIWQARIANNALLQARESEKEANDSKDELELFTNRLIDANKLLASGRALVTNGNIPEAYAEFTRATETQPRYFHVWVERGSLYVRLGLWEEAAADYRKAIDLGFSVEGPEFLGVPQLIKFVDDSATHQTVSSAILKSTSVKVETKIRGLLIGDISAKLASELVIEAEALVDGNSGRPSRRIWIPTGARRYMAGWAHLKAGHFEHAIKHLKLADDGRWPGNGLSLPLLAIAYHRAGQSNEADLTLQKSKQQLFRWLDDSIKRRNGSAPIPWFDWLEFISNHQAASKLITGNQTDISQFLDEAKTLARSTLIN